MQRNAKFCSLLILYIPAYLTEASMSEVRFAPCPYVQLDVGSHVGAHVGTHVVD